MQAGEPLATPDPPRPPFVLRISASRLATGGTMGACCRLVDQLGGQVVGTSFVVELAFLNGRELLKPYRVHSLVSVPGEEVVSTHDQAD